MKPFINYTPLTSKPTLKQFNVKVLKVLADYQNESYYFPTRREILMKVYDWTEAYTKTRRNQMSTMFRNMIYNGLINYDENFRYHITAKGVDRLIEALRN